MSAKWWFFFAVLVVGVALDYWTKQLALTELQYGVTRLEWDGALKLTLSFNRGAAFGMSLGSASRPIFIVFTVLTLGWLGYVFAHSRSSQKMRLSGIACVCAGAIGNLIDRVTSADGVVDFLGPYDLGIMVWPIFNVADIFVVVGIAMLLISMRGQSLHEVGEAADATIGAAEPAPGVAPAGGGITETSPRNDPAWRAPRNSEGA